MKTSLIITIFVVVFVLIIGGVYLNLNSKKNSGTSILPPDVPSNVPLNVNQINIENLAFSPSSLNVKVGELVIWKNLDSASHKIISNGEPKFESPQLANGEEFSYIFPIAGTYDYYCSIHPSMKGVIIVK